MNKGSNEEMQRWHWMDNNMVDILDSALRSGTDISSYYL